MIPLMTAMALTVAATTAPAQSPARRQADSVLLSDDADGDYRVRRYLVKEQDDADYSIRYRISSAQLNTSFEGNQSQLSGLGELVDGLLADTLTQVERVSITGYASPDGPLALNRNLARRRMQDFRNYVDRRYGFSRKYDVQSGSAVVSWADIRNEIAASAVPDRPRVLEILDSNLPDADKQAALKRMPAVWNYLAANILPPLRRVEVQIDYGQGVVVEQRTRCPRPVPEEIIVVEPACPPPAPQDPCCEELCRSSRLGVIVAMPDNDVDF